MVILWILYLSKDYLKIKFRCVFRLSRVDCRFVLDDVMHITKDLPTNSEDCVPYLKSVR